MSVIPHPAAGGAPPANDQAGLPFALTHHDRLLVLNFPEPQRFLSWSITRPGFQSGRRVAWLELQNAELSEQVDADTAIRQRLNAAGYLDAIALVTARDVRRHHSATCNIDGTSVCCFTTVGLANGERVGRRFAPAAYLLGTVNTLLHVSACLTESALVELVSIVATARTTAIMDADVRRDGVAISGTGTDCIAVAAPASGEAQRFAGMHTAIGEAAGRAVYDATCEGITVWQADYAAYLRGLASR